MVFQVCETLFLKFHLPLRNYGAPIPPHVLWPNSWPPVAPHCSPLLHHPQLFVCLAMNASEMKCMLDHELKANNQLLMCFACTRLLVCFH